MRNVDSKNQIWFIKDGNVTKVGLTQSFINSLEECWQILPANLRRVKEKSPLLTIETNDALISVASPVSGSVIRVDDHMRNFPDRLREDTVLIEIQEGRAVPEPPIGEDVLPDRLEAARFALRVAPAWEIGDAADRQRIRQPVAPAVRNINPEF